MRNKLLTIVGVIALFAMTGMASAQNLLTNGDFETGNTNDWTIWVWGDSYFNVDTNVMRDFSTSAPTNGGNGTYVLNVGNGWGGGAGGGAGAYQTVPVTAGEEYQLSVDCGAADWWLPWGDMQMIWMDSTQTNAISTNQVWTLTPEPGEPGSYGYNWDVPHPMATFIMNATAPVGAEYVKVEFASRMPGGDGGSITFDNALLLEFSDVDTDGDGMTDAWELANSLDPNDATGANGASGDPDGDSLLNIDEFNNGSSPNLADTDGDGLDDFEEVNTHGTDPTLADTDGDGLSDYDELNTHGTDPNLADTDGDGENDDFELFQGTDPTDIASSSAAIGIPTVDGTLDAALYGAPLAVQTCETSGSDALGWVGTNYVSGTELDAAYAVVKNGKLYLMVTGNVSNDWGMVNIYIDSTAAVSNDVLDTVGVTPDPVGEIAAQNGITFDAGFSPDYMLFQRGSYNAGWDFSYISFINLKAKTHSEYPAATTSEAIEVNYITGTGVNAHPIGVALDNSNTNGVVAGTGAADPIAAAAVATGLELSIDLADLGSPTGLVRVAVIAADNGNAYLLNQVLAGVPAPQGDLGTTFTVDFSGIPGDQFFVALDASLDTDGDGMPDIWEQSFGLDPNSTVGDDGAAGDPDADGLANIDELNNSTSPQNPDTDEDGLTDSEEVDTYFTDPNDWDTDDDGLSDVDEVTVHLTDPNLADSDSDGEDDPFELFQGTDPMDAASSSAALGLAIADGTLDAAYGAALAVQTVNTAWTNDMDELDAAYAVIQNDRLYLMLTGNMNTNWNSVEIFIDSTDAVTTNVFTAQGHDNTDVMNGLVFDEGFSPDHHLNIRMGTWDGNTNELGEANFSFNLNWADLATGAESWQDNAFGNEPEGTHLMGTGDVNSNSAVAIGFDNSNAAGVVWGQEAANQADALAVSTGLELSIALADLGNPAGEIRIMAMVTGSNTNTGDHSISGNQVLPGLLPAPQPELGTTSNINFSAIAGDQFFTIAIPVALPPHVASATMNAGHTMMMLNLSDLVAGMGYEIHESSDLQAGFTTVVDSWTAAAASEARSVPVDTGANPVMFYQVVAP